MRRSAFIALCLLAVICGGWMLQRREAAGSIPPDASASASSSREAQGGSTAERMNQRRAAEAQTLPGALTPPPAVTSEEEKNQRLDAIHEASTLYAPEGIPAIKPYLLDPDPEIRAAAKDGLIVLGESGGSAALREAAKQLKDPREATVFLEAADYLQLPSYTETEAQQQAAGIDPAVSTLQDDTPAQVITEPQPEPQQQ